MATVVREGTTQTKVLIIGAGIAGISSAEYLAKNGFTDFKIIEAADRIGGRIWTHDIGGTSLKVEMGANWIHGIERNPIYQIADENGLLQLRYKDKGLRHRNIFLTETGVEVHSKTVMECDFTYGLLIQQCEEFFQMSMPTPYDIDSVGDYMDVEIEEKLENFMGSERKMREMIFNQHIKQETVVSGCNDLHEVSLSEFGCYEELPGVHYTIPPGFQSVLDILLGKVPENNILLNHTVKSIRWGNNDNDGGVLVECENGRKFSAERIIWTCSLGVLKASCDRMIDPPVDRMFDPPLPKEKRDAIERLGFGVVDRVNLIFDEPIVDTDIFRIELLWDDESYNAENRNPDMSTLWYRKLYSFEVVNDNLLSVAAGFLLEYWL
ncbi:hypothetical protein DPMN_059811 [Dreissena polymorpha]|uniref:Amine oxidase domain-containing protein n=1 Tax=Dreissena polymorpha TaxID=45954 RepID=A0A9D4C4L8_DREPO|nr:hypothetical protein DPMN_059811 [Dreissena polymorpha]